MDRLYNKCRIIGLQKQRRDETEKHKKADGNLFCLVNHRNLGRNHCRNHCRNRESNRLLTLRE